MDVVLGIDLGTSSVKAVLTAERRVLASTAASLATSSLQPGWSEQNPGDWCDASAQAVRSVLTELPSARVIGIGLSGQMHGAVLLSPSDEVLRPAILWNDNRAFAECAELRRHVPEIGLLAGVPPQPGFTAPKLMWLKNHDPKLHAQIAAILLPKDYVRLWLAGEKATDVSDAAGTLWLDQANGVWSEQIVQASGTDPSQLPPLSFGHEQSGVLRGSVAAELGLDQGIPVFAGGGDAATGAISLGAASSGKMFVSLGTSGQLMVVDDTYRPNPDAVIHAFAHTIPGLWYRMAAMLNGARPLAWFADVLGSSVEEMLLQAERADCGRVPLFLPYLSGERSPHGDPDIRAGFYGLDGTTGAPEMARSVVEAVAFMMRDAFDSFGGDLPDVDAIPVIGGGSRSDLVLQNLANVLERPVARAAAGEGGAAFGAALLAEIGLGRMSLADLSVDLPLNEVFEPNSSPATMARLPRFRELYTRLKGGL